MQPPTYLLLLPLLSPPSSSPLPRPVALLLPPSAWPRSFRQRFTSRCSRKALTFFSSRPISLVACFGWMGKWIDGLICRRMDRPMGCVTKIKAHPPHTATHRVLQPLHRGQVRATLPLHPWPLPLPLPLALLLRLVRLGLDRPWWQRRHHSRSAAGYVGYERPWLVIG